MKRCLTYAILIGAILDLSWAYSNSCSIKATDSQSLNAEPSSCNASPWVYDRVFETPEKIGRILNSSYGPLQGVRTNDATCGYTRSIISRVEVTKSRYFAKPSYGDRMNTPAQTCIMQGVDFIVNVEGASRAPAGCPVTGPDSGSYLISEDQVKVHDVLDCELNVWRPRTPEEEVAHKKSQIAKIKDEYTEVESPCSPMRVRTRLSLGDSIFGDRKYGKSSRCFLHLTINNHGELHQDESSYNEIGDASIVDRIENGQEICVFKHKKWNYYLHTLSTGKEVSYYPGMKWNKCWINGKNLRRR